MTERDGNLPEKVPIPQALRFAILLQQSGKLEEAEGVYRQVLETVPDHPDALHFLGVLRHQQKRSEEALELMHRSAELAPGHAGFRNNLGNVYREMNRVEDAEAEYRKTLEIEPEHADALNNLGTLERIRGNRDGAVELFQRAIAADSEHRDAHLNLAAVYNALGREEDSLKAYERVVAIEPFNEYAYWRLGYAYHRAGNRAKAEAVIRKWLEHRPDHPVAKHLLAACLQGEDVPERASDEVVRKIFDSFAASFDAKLELLSYRAPQLLAGTLDERLGEPAGDAVVLDAGCGTGLCGPLLRPRAGRLVGVDLSGPMVEMARKREAYDELHVAELTAFMEERPDSFDLIVSSDTLCYFGALERVTAAARTCLRPGGTLAFTVEALREDEPGEGGYVLRPHGRYAHRERYVREVLAAAGFERIATPAGHLRIEAREPVDGYVVTAFRKE